MNWQIGDRAIYDCPESVGGAHMAIITITSELGPFISIADGPIIGHRFDPGFAHPSARHFVNTPDHFKPIPEEYDGKQVSTWDECPFKPKEVCHVDN